jgi:DNA helicase-2/ATP-dependent DNA helicase PcrA
MPLDEFYDALLERTGYTRSLEEKASDENKTRIEYVQELKTNIFAFVKETEGGTLADFLDEIALYTDLEQYSREDDCVVLMTMHSAKGLEFPTVFVVGAEEGIFPGIRAIGELPEMEEERRLCYVAMTRAKSRLIFTCARQRMLFGRTTAARFPALWRRSGRVYYKACRQAELRFPPAGMKQALLKAVKKQVVSRCRAGGTEKSGEAGLPKGRHGFAQGLRPGLITSVQQVGGDALIEIAFDGAGTKRLMMNAAAKHMTKI